MASKARSGVPSPFGPDDDPSRRSAELALLNRVILAATSTQDPVELLTILCRELAQIFAAPQAGAALLNEEHTSLTVVAEYLADGRSSSMGHIIPVEGNLATQHVLKHREPLPIEDVLEDPRMAPVRHLMEERGTRSMLILPLQARDELIGTIGLDLIERRAFTEDEVRLAFSAARSTSQSLANARIFRQLETTLAELRELSEAQERAKEEQARRNAELALLNRVILATTSAQDPVELLTIICRELAQIFAAPQAGAALLNEEQTSLTVVAEYLAEGRSSSLGHVIPVEGNLATQHVLKHREPLPIEDVLEDPRMAPVRHLMEERRTRSMLILPLQAREELIGTIGLDLIEHHEFTEAEVQLAFSAARSTSQSLATARMFDRIQVTLAELQRVEEARRHAPDDLDRYLPETIREKIERTYYARVNQQAELDQAVRSKDFVEDPLNHVALFSDHGVVHVRDVARNIVSILDTINGVLIPHRNRLWLDFMKGYGVMLAYNHDIGMMDFTDFGRAMHPEFAAQAVFGPEFDAIVDAYWDENWGNVSWRLIKLAEHGALDENLKTILRELLAMSIGHSKSKVSNDLLNDPEALRGVMLESVAADLPDLNHRQVLRRAEAKLAESRAAGDEEAIAAWTAELGNAQRRYQEHLARDGETANQHLERHYTDFEAQAFTWLVSDHPALQALTRDVIDTLRALRVADALRQRGTALKTSGGYQIFIDQNTANAVIALQKSSGEMMMFEVDKTHSIGEANIASSELALGGDLRVSFHRGSFRTGEAARHAAYCCAMIVDDIQKDVLDSFRRPNQPSTQRKHSDDIQILIEETDDNIHFAEMVLDELGAINPELTQRSRIVPSLKNISDSERQRYLTGAELNWSLERRREVIDRVAQTGHKIRRIDPELAFTDVRQVELRQGEILLEAGAPPGFVYVPTGDGLQSQPSGGYQRHAVQAWIPLGNTSVIRGDVQEAQVTAEKSVRLLMIPKEIYLKYWHDTYNLAEFAPTIDRLFAEDELHRMDQVLRILKQVVMIDGRPADGEIQLIRRVIRSMGGSAKAEDVRAELLASERTDFATLRLATVEYLDSSPPYLQVARLRDLVNLVVDAGGTASDGKRLMLGELSGLLVEHLDRDETAVPFQVVVVPQSEEQDGAIRALLPSASRIETGYGFAYLCDTFHSREYAEMICNRYRSLRMFALVVHGEGNDIASVDQPEEVDFTAAEREMYATFIHRLTPAEFMLLVRTGEWEQVATGETLIREGDTVDRILFIREGTAVVTSKGTTLHDIYPGSFVGEMEFLAGGPAIATVTAISPMSYITWQKESLQKLMELNPEMQSTMQTLFSADVVKKLHSSIEKTIST
jgi:GAF domain-containing protein/CRP-like cAMP-binding protein